MVYGSRSLWNFNGLGSIWKDLCAIEQLDMSLFCYNKTSFNIEHCGKLKHITVERHYAEMRYDSNIHNLTFEW